ncbi:MAG: RNA polymerase sigma factor RpoD/SigA [Chitinophagaceae bacterium]|nr:RNA polymerase sigma factor RpoD/SigA [Chitinophagaceae bacterium]
MRQLKISKSVTSRESESLGKYLQEISKVDLLSPEEEGKLFSLIQKGDKNALDHLTKANLRFVVSVAKQYQGQGLSLSDLINEGNIGLIQAAKKFDVTKGFKFISYAVWWIRQNMLQALASDSHLVRLPYNKKVLGNRIQKANDVLEQSLERTASAEEVADYLGVDSDEVASRMAIHVKHVSLDKPFSEDEDNTLMDSLQTADGVNDYEKASEAGSFNTELERAMMVLNKRQKEVLYSYFGINTGFPMSLDEIARNYNLTRERVRQIKDKAIMLLKNKTNYYLLRGFLG